MKPEQANTETDQQPESGSTSRSTDGLACGWTEESEGIAWATGCGHLFDVNDGTPKQNGMNYCCFCGRSLIQTPYTDEQANH